MIDEFHQMTNRRSMIKSSAAMIGACLIGTAVTPVKAQSAHANNHDPIDVKSFGATGKREQNATKPFRDAIEACVKRGGGTVNVSPGEYTVGTIQLKGNITLNI